MKSWLVLVGLLLQCTFFGGDNTVLQIQSDERPTQSNEPCNTRISFGGFACGTMVAFATAVIIWGEVFSNHHTKPVCLPLDRNMTNACFTVTDVHNKTSAVQCSLPGQATVKTIKDRYPQLAVGTNLPCISSAPCFEGMLCTQSAKAKMAQLDIALGRTHKDTQRKKRKN